MKVYQREGRPGGDTEAALKSMGADYCESNAVTLQLRQRRQASHRLLPLDCGCRDPWRPWRPEKLSERQIAGAAAAALHLLDEGYAPLFDVPMLQAMWKAGHHGLAEELAR
ncbi:hypothetical protein BH09ACT7_BH09ACT7_32490 [soil metagenome]